MNTIKFEIRSLENVEHIGGYEVRILVDGCDYIADTDESPPPVGLSPPDLYWQEALLSGGQLLYARCCCGCIGCGDCFVTVVCADENVTWQRTDRTDVIFDEQHYKSALAMLRADTSWESEEDNFLRKVSDLDLSNFKVAGWQLIWVSRQPETSTMQLTFRRNSNNHATCTLPYNGGDRDSMLQTLAIWASTAGPKDFDSVPDQNDPELIAQALESMKRTVAEKGFTDKDSI